MKEDIKQRVYVIFLQLHKVQLEAKGQCLVMCVSWLPIRTSKGTGIRM